MLLGVGVALNLAIAWTIAAVGAESPRSGEHGVSSRTFPYWGWDSHQYWGMTRIEARAVSSPNSNEDENDLAVFYDNHSGSLPGWVQFCDPAAVPADASRVLIEAFGWPFRAMYCEWSRDYDETLRSHSLRRGIALKPDINFEYLEITPRALPTGILLTGFTINSLFFAAALGLGMYLISWARRRRRLALGECPFCGYPAGQSDVCSECGQARPPANPGSVT